MLIGSGWWHSLQCWALIGWGGRGIITNKSRDAVSVIDHQKTFQLRPAGFGESGRPGRDLSRTRRQTPDRHGDNIVADRTREDAGILFTRKIIEKMK